MREDVRGQFVLRDALESKAARIYWGEILIEKSEELLAFARRVDQAPSDHLEDWKTEILFHRELVSLAGVPVLTEAFDRTMRLNLFYAMARIIPVHLATERDNHVILLQNFDECGKPGSGGKFL